MADNGVSPAEHAALTQRVTGVEAAVESIRKDIHALVSKFDERSRFPTGSVLAGAALFWTVITSFVTIGGGVVAWGLLSLIGDIKTAQRDFEAHTAIELREMRGESVSRNEWSERNLARDREVENIRESRVRGDEDLQRQITQAREDHQALAASLGNGGNSIKELKDEVAKLWEWNLKQQAGERQ